MTHSSISRTKQETPVRSPFSRSDEYIYYIPTDFPNKLLKFRRDSVDDFYLIAVREKIYGRPCLLLPENVLGRPTVTFFNCKGILKSCIVLKQKEFSIISAKFFIVPQSQ